MGIGRRSVAALGVAAAVAAAGGVAYATVPDGAGVVHGCYATTFTAGRSGQLRVIDTGKSQVCQSGEQPLDWNQKGPTGPQGPQGPPGPQGPQGPPGLSGYESVEILGSFTLPASQGDHLTAPCPKGKRAIGGGGAVRDFTLKGSEPDPNNPQTGWTVTFENATGNTLMDFVTAFAICAT